MTDTDKQRVKRIV